MNALQRIISINRLPVPHWSGISHLGGTFCKKYGNKVTVNPLLLPTIQFAYFLFDYKTTKSKDKQTFFPLLSVTVLSENNKN